MRACGVPRAACCCPPGSGREGAGREKKAGRLIAPRRRREPGWVARGAAQRAGLGSVARGTGSSSCSQPWARRRAAPARGYL
eukprot:scaffold4189_cov378-Prasinococcus_capsulatus_cf.AAC.6